MCGEQNTADEETKKCQNFQEICLKKPFRIDCQLLYCYKVNINYIIVLIYLFTSISCLVNLQD